MKNGEFCVARWEEDGIWYNGQIETPNPDGSFMVKFVDYGNSAAVAMPNIVKSAQEIPETVPDYDVDENVGSRCKNPAQNLNVKEIQAEVNIEVEEQGPLLEDKNSSGKMPVNTVFRVLDACVAKWSEDQVWYNAIIQLVNADGSYSVVFTDYGNTDIVEKSFVASDASHIPVDEQIDENIKMPLAHSDKDNADKIYEKETENVTNDVKETKILEQKQDTLLSGPLPVETIFHVNDICIAKWSEDEVWYDAVIQSVNADGSYVVQFTDYGNTDTVDKAFVVSDASKISKENDECLDENVILVQSDETDAEGTLKQETTLVTSTNNVEEPKILEQKPFLEVKKMTDKKTVKTGFRVDDVCVAKWSEDQVWYNAKIQSLDADGSYSVLFTDYGNTDTVEKSLVASDASHIPEDDQIDENIKMPLAPSDKNNAEETGRFEGRSEQETQTKPTSEHTNADQSKLEDPVATREDSEAPRQRTRTISASGKRMITDAMNKVIFRKIQ